MKKIELFGLFFLSSKQSEVASLIVASARKHDCLIAVTPNVDHIVQLEKDRNAMEIFKNADFVVADGMPLVWLSRILFPRSPLPERVNGTNLMVNVCQIASTEGLTVAFVGGKPNAAELASQKLVQQFPELKVVGVYCPPMGFEQNLDETASICAMINQWRPDILCLGVGTPKQEKWISANKNHLDVGVTLCIGASIEFVAGLVSRAPIWMQNTGFEWLWRLIMEPRRLWRRYLVRDMRFFLLAFREIIDKITARHKI